MQKAENGNDPSKGESLPKKIGSFTQLEAWRESHKLVIMIYQQTKLFPKDETFGLTNQIRRAAVSITSNIAEGFGRNSYREKTQFYRMSLGSLREVQNQILIARDVSYVSSDIFNEIADQTIRASNLLTGLIKSSLAKSQSAIPNSEFRIHHERGAILLELLLSLSILTVVIVGLLAALLSATELHLKSQRQAVATTLASQELEILRGRPLASLTNQTSGPLIGSPLPALSQLPVGNASLTISDYQTDPQLKQIVVEISFREGSRRVFLTFATLIGAGGLNG